MENVKIYITSRSEHCDWIETIKQLSLRGYKVAAMPEISELSIVLSGRYENPIVLSGKKVLAFDAEEWFSSIPAPWGWQMMEKILRHYYDDFINLTALSGFERAKEIVNYIQDIGNAK